MKRSGNRLLLLVFILSLAAYLALVWEYGTGILYPSPVWLQRLWSYLLLGLHGVPVFCLQLLLCRGRRRWPALALCVLVAGAALVCAVGFYTAKGWDALGWGILLLGCAAPAVGSLLAWIAWGLGRRGKKDSVRGKPPAGPGIPH